MGSPCAWHVAWVLQQRRRIPDRHEGSCAGIVLCGPCVNECIEVGTKFVKLAKNAGLTPAQLGVLWCKEQPGVTAPLIGPQKVEHLEDLIPVLEMTLSDELREACDNLVPPGSAVANFHNTAGWMKQQLL